MTTDDAVKRTMDAWLKAACEDAERRGLPELKPLLEGLAQSTVALRRADWNDTVPAAGGRGRPGEDR
jgi:hypothetical protein